MEINLKFEEVRTLLSLHKGRCPESFRDRGVAPISASFINDMQTPISIYKKITNEKPYSFLFESRDQACLVSTDQRSRYSFIGLNPKKILEFKNGICEIKEDKKIKFVEFKNPLKIIEKELKNFNVGNRHASSLPILTGGAIGFFSYEASKYFEKIPEAKKDTLNIPDGIFGIYDMIICFDHLKHKIIFIKYLDLNTDDLKKDYDNILNTFEVMKDRICSVETCHGMSLQFTRELPLEKKFKSNLTKKEFIEKTKKILEKIKKGETFQLQLSQRLSLDLKKGDNSFDIYRRLRILNPSPYMYFMKYPDFDIVGASPETSLRVENRNILIKPIAGTRKRTGDYERDKKLENELINSKKEQAEHTMLVDLARNDMGRVAEISSVESENIMHLEKFSHVIHLVSDIRGKLKKDKTIFDAFAATFPHGTVTGAPKIRSQELIAKFENEKRGIYAGTVGYFDFNGNTDSAIAIRTIVVKNNTAYIQAAGGIVYDSIPEMEYKESLNKMSGCLAAIL